VVYATYTKIGNQVTVQAWIRTDNVDATGASGGVFISGLPFTASNRHSGCIGVAVGFVNHPIEINVAAAGSTVIGLFKRASITGSSANVLVSDLTTGATADQNRLQFAMTYFV